LRESPDVIAGRRPLSGKVAADGRIASHEKVNGLGLIIALGETAEALLEHVMQNVRLQF